MAQLDTTVDQLFENLSAAKQFEKDRVLVQLYCIVNQVPLESIEDNKKFSFPHVRYFFPKQRRGYTIKYIVESLSSVGGA
ncbi:MAG: hypothetical protein Q8R37_02305 [Nanoarchaeota archaeon]|nr:hypothetical protein [Nanoarchaeota archaeon]